MNDDLLLKIKLFAGSLLARIVDYWKYIAILFGALILIWLFSATFQSCGDWMDNRNANKMRENINAIEREANGQQLEVNRQGENYNAQKEETNNARNETNRALDNLNAVNGIDYNGSNYANANAARCRYNPSGKGCR